MCVLSLNLRCHKDLSLCKICIQENRIRNFCWYSIHICLSRFVEIEALTNLYFNTKINNPYIHHEELPIYDSEYKFVDTPLLHFKLYL